MLNPFFEELRRRRVPQALGLYLAGGWISFEVADSAFVRLGLPDWTVTLVLALVLAGIPIAVTVAWFFDFTRDGMRVTEATEQGSDPSTRTGSPESPRRRGWVLSGAVVTGLLLAAVAVWGGRGSQPSASIAGNGLVVFPFIVRGGEEAAVLGEGMVGLLSRKLDGVGDIRSVDPNTVLTRVGGAVEASAARELARELGGTYYLLGNVLEFGGSLNLQVSVYTTDGDGESLADASVEGPVESFQELVDDLAAQLVVNGRLAPSGMLPHTAVLTTSEFPALKNFVEGERALRDRRFADAIEQFDLAIEVDSAFALAHYRKALAASWLERPELSQLATNAAWKFRDRLSPSDRDRLAAFEAERAGRNAEAERLYRAILASHPADVEAWYELGEVLLHSGPLLGIPLTEARVPFERAAELDPEHALALDHLSLIAAWTRDSTALDTVTRRMKQLLGSDFPLTLEAQWTFMMGDSTARTHVLERVFESGSGFPLLYAVWSTDDVGDMRRLLNVASQLPTTPFDWGQGSRLAGIGQRDEALDWLAERESSESTAPARTALLATQRFLRTPTDRLEALHKRLLAWEPGPVRDTPLTPAELGSLEVVAPQLRVYLLGLIDLILGRPADAAEWADELEAMSGVDEVRSLAADMVLHMRAEMELAEGRPEEALAIIEQASFWETSRWDSRLSMLFSHTGPVLLRSEALAATGRYREALRWYETFSLGPHPFGYAWYRAAQTHEALGETKQAAELYANFIARWAEADPELQELVEDARQRLDALGTVD